MVVCLRSGWQVTNSGGNANETANAGTFYLNANNTSSNINRNISGQLCLFGVKKTYNHTPW